MNLTQRAVITIASTTLSFVALPISQAEASYQTYTCQALSDRLNFLYEYGGPGYFIAGDTFPCTTSDDGRSLRSVVDGRTVVFTFGSVSIDGFPFLVEGGILIEAD